MGFWKTMEESIFASDWYIGVAAILTIVALAVSLKFMSSIKKEIQKKESSKAIILREEQYLEWCYNMFITLITLFPLLGMFGTVAALLSLDLTGEIEQIKGNFFNALTSTAWGIVFSVLFKIANAIVENKIKQVYEKARKLTENIADDE